MWSGYNFFVNQLLSFQNISESLTVMGEVQFTRYNMEISFHLSDPTFLVQDSLTPHNWDVNTLQRADELWKTTCFEAFWALPGQNSYWELNLSTSGQWNLYYFESYRKPDPPIWSHDFLLMKVETEKNNLTCTLQSKVPIEKLEISLCTILRLTDKTCYFSTAHKREKPDFHARESFILQRSSS